MILKLDMEKAYDRVNWFFMDQILEMFGSATKWRLWISKCILTPKFYVLVNDEVAGFLD